MNRSRFARIIPAPPPPAPRWPVKPRLPSVLELAPYVAGFVLASPFAASALGLMIHSAMRNDPTGTGYQFIFWMVAVTLCLGCLSGIRNRYRDAGYPEQIGRTLWPLVLLCGLILWLPILSYALQS
jgi:hypothetical protein